MKDEELEERLGAALRPFALKDCMDERVLSRLPEGPPSPRRILPISEIFAAAAVVLMMVGVFLAFQMNSIHQPSKPSVSVEARGPQDGVSKWIERLGDENPEVRDQATRELRKLGKEALDKLRKVKSDDPEVERRIEMLIDEIGWPEPGAVSNGLAIAIKAQKEYAVKGDMMVRGRIFNLSEKDIVLKTVIGGNSCAGSLLLHLDKETGSHHPGYGAPGHSVPEYLKLEKGERFDFTFSFQGWCDDPKSHEHKCGEIKVIPHEYKLSLTLKIDGADEGDWTGAVASNEVHLVVKE